MTFTECGTKVTREWMPLAIANGIEWGQLRSDQPDKWDCLYRRGIVNRALWYLGVLISPIVTL